MSLIQLASEIGREAARIVLCSPCVVCGTELPWLNRVGSCCRTCWSSLPRLAAKCVKCALPAPEPGLDQFLCVGCADEDGPLQWVDAWGRYGGGLDAVVQAFKFTGHDFLAAALAALMNETYRTRGDLDFELVAAVPMHRRKQARRGFNQADLLAIEFARIAHLPYDRALLRQKHERSTQASLPRRERVVNVRGVYTASANAAGRSILLIDDICTTGATLRACAAALKRAGAERVCALVVARA